MRVGTLWGCVVVGVVTLGACTGSDDPTREKSAVYFGLADGKTLSFDVTGGPTATTASFNYKSNTSFADRLGFTQEERNGANVVRAAETLVFGVELENLVLLRAGDCLPNCTDYLNPPKLLDNPLVANSSFESETQVILRTATGQMDGGRERHSITVGAEVALPTPAGTFKAFNIVWRIFPSGGGPSVDTSFYFAPDKGFVQWQKAGLTYKAKSGVSP